VNSNIEGVLGLKAYRSLLEVEVPVDVVDVFRSSNDIPQFAEQSLHEI
jgi:predicted CoA-binding protein